MTSLEDVVQKIRVEMDSKGLVEPTKTATKALKKLTAAEKAAAKVLFKIPTTPVPAPVPAPVPVPVVSKAPNISTVEGAPPGATIGAFVSGKGFEIKDKNGKVVGHAKQ